MFGPKITTKKKGKFVPIVLMLIRADLSHDRTTSYFGMVSEKKIKRIKTQVRLQKLESR
jgi:hypothetical protein